MSLVRRMHIDTRLYDDQMDASLKTVKYSPDVDCQKCSNSASSSICQSDDSGLDRTQNLSSTSPLPEDTDSEDSNSLDGFKIPHATVIPVELLRQPGTHFRNTAESAQHSPSGNCVAATREPHHYQQHHRTPTTRNSDNRFHILSHDQVHRLSQILTKTIPVHSRQPGFPTIWVTLSKLFRAVTDNLKHAAIPVRDIRLNGGAASYAISMDNASTYNDVDILISVDLSSNSSTIQRVKQAVLDALLSFLPDANEWNSPVDSMNNPSFSPTEQDGDLIQCLTRGDSPLTESEQQLGSPNTLSNARGSPHSCLHVITQHSPNSAVNNMASPSNNMSIRESYVYKQFRKFSTHETDCWSLLSLGAPSNESKVIEFKFVDRMRRQFEFTVDSFQIILDSMLSFMDKNPKAEITPNFYPTVVAESVAGSFTEAFYHLKNKLITTKEPEMIRGGGLLKYCRLLVNGYQAADGIDISSLERYMSSRFFIDFQDLDSQKCKIEAFLTNHFNENELEAKIEFLQTFYRVVSGSTVCLMSYEHYQSLNLIRGIIQELMHKVHTQRSSLCLDWFTEQQNLVLDEIYLGTDLFPVISNTTSYRVVCCDCDNPHKPHWNRTSESLQTDEETQVKKINTSPDIDAQLTSQWEESDDTSVIEETPRGEHTFPE